MVLSNRDVRYTIPFFESRRHRSRLVRDSLALESEDSFPFSFRGGRDYVSFGRGQLLILKEI